MLNLKKDPAWFSSLLPLPSEVVILLQGDGPERQVSVPAALLVASSPLVRNILSVGHLPPAFSIPVICIPSVSADILVGVVEMLVLGTISMDRTGCCQVMEVFKMMGIAFETEVTKNNLNMKILDNVSEEVDNPDCLEKLVGVVPEEWFQDGQINSENVKLEINVKLEKDLQECPSPDLMPIDQAERQLNLSKKETRGINREKGKDIMKKIKRQKNMAVSSNVDQEKDLMVATKQSCPQCGKMISIQNMNKHIMRMHVKETEQCPHCDKSFCWRGLRRHIRAVHDKETVQCPHCDKVLGCNSLFDHIRFMHKQNA